MREMGFTEKWPKLHLELPVEQRPQFTTWRLPRKDADRGRGWAVGEVVKVVFRPRSPRREVLGVAEIVGMSPLTLAEVTEEKAQEDGFDSYGDMVAWFKKVHGRDIEQKWLTGMMLMWRAL